MNMYENIPVAERFAALAPQPLDGDWDDVLGRAGAARRVGRRLWAPHVRVGSPRHRRVVALAAAALVVAVASASAFGTVRDLLFAESRSAPVWAGAPTWSPDGRRIAFVTVPCDAQACNGPREVHVMNADGSGQRNLTREWGLKGLKGPPPPDADEPTFWSPDWRRIAFLRERGVFHTFADGFQLRYADVYVMNSDGSGRRRLTRSPEMDGDPAWSPDGRRLAFVRVRGGRSDIYVVNRDGSGLRRLAHAITFRPMPGSSSGFAANPAWSPDGQKIAFMSNRDGKDDIFVVNADGSGLRNLTRSRGNYYKPIYWGSGDGPMWSPDGRKILFTSDRLYHGPGTRDGGPGGANEARRRARYDEIYVVGADGSGLRRLTRNSRSDGSPVWSPDGRKVLFTRSSGSVYSDSDVYVMNADGRGQRNLTPSLTHPFATDTTPAWSPDGRRILFVSNRDGKGEVYVMNANGSGLRKLTQLKGQT